MLQHAVTDDEGRFTLSASGRVRLFVSCLGFAPYVGEPFDAVRATGRRGAAPRRDGRRYRRRGGRGRESQRNAACRAGAHGLYAPQQRLAGGRYGARRAETDPRRDGQRRERNLARRQFRSAGDAQRQADLHAARGAGRHAALDARLVGFVRGGDEQPFGAVRRRRVGRRHQHQRRARAKCRRPLPLVQQRLFGLGQLAAEHRTRVQLQYRPG